MATERTVLVRLKANASDFVRGIGTATAAVRGLRHEINTTNDRTAWLAQSILALGPALVPLGAAGVPILTGLATQLTFTGVAAGTLGLAFNGVGDALKALNDYQLEPTDAHLRKLTETMAKIGPEGEQFVRFIDSLGPELHKLSDISREGFFPGATDGLEQLMTLLPEVKRIVRETSQTLGDLARDAGTDLAGPRFEEFFHFLETDARQILTEMGQTVINFADGLAAMLVAFAPLSREFSTGFEEMSQSFADWAHQLPESATFQEFLAYIRDSGPKALDLLESIAQALVAVLQAAAPVGSLMLPVLSELFDIVAKLADTPLGPIFLAAAAGASVYGRTMAIVEATTGGAFKGILGGWQGVITAEQRATWSAEKLAAAESKRSMQLRRSAVAAGGLALASSGLADKIGLGNTASLAMMGTLAGPWGAAVGGAVGVMQDLSDAGDGVAAALDRADAALRSTATGAGRLEELQAALADLKKQAEDLDHSTSFFEGLKDHLVNMWEGDWRSKATQIPVVGSWVSIFGHAQTGADKLAASIHDTSSEISSLESHRGIGTLITAGLGAPARQAGYDIDTAAAATAQWNQNLSTLQQNLSQAQQIVAFRKAVRDLTKTVHDNPLGKTLSTGLDKKGAQGDEIRSQLLSIIQLAQTAAQGMTDLDQVGFLRRTRKEVLQRAKDLGLPVQAVRDMLDEFGIVNNTPVKPQVDPKPAKRKVADLDGTLDAFIKKHWFATIDANPNPARAKLSSFEQYLVSLTRPRTVNVGVHIHKGSIGKGGSGDIGSLLTPADGTTVPGSRYPYGDRVPALLAPTEEVISNRYGQADRWRPLLKAINANRLADGGTAGFPGLHHYLTKVLGIDMPHGLKEWNKALELSKKTIDKERAARDDIVSKREDLASTVSGNFTSDLFGAASNPWAASSTNGVFGTLLKDIASARQFLGASASLKNAGLSGDAFAALAGQASPEQLAAFANNPEMVRQFQSLFDQRAALAAQAGQAAGTAAFGSQETAATAHLQHLVVQNRHLIHEVQLLRKEAAHHAKTTGAEVGKQVNGAGAQAKRRRKR